MIPNMVSFVRRKPVRETYVEQALELVDQAMQE
jgi:hypothetical protein